MCVCVIENVQRLSLSEEKIKFHFCIDTIFRLFECVICPMWYSVFVHINFISGYDIPYIKCRYGLFFFSQCRACMCVVCVVYIFSYFLIEFVVPVRVLITLDFIIHFKFRGSYEKPKYRADVPEQQ